MVRGTAEYLGWVVAIVGALTTLWVVARRGLRRAAKVVGVLSAIVDVMVGRPPTLHPETGDVLLPASPGIGTRMATIESRQEETWTILVRLADAHELIGGLAGRLSRIEQSLGDHLAGRCPLTGTCNPPCGADLDTPGMHHVRTRTTEVRSETVKEQT